MIKLCECGCGQETTYYRGEYRRFISGHHPQSKKTRKKQSKSRKIYLKKHPEWKDNMSKARKGIQFSEEWKLNMRVPHIGAGIYERTEKTKNFLKTLNCGRKWSDEYKENMRKATIGKEVSEETRQKISGANSYNWKGGITSLYEAIRKCFEYKEWRNNIFRRDNFTCQKCRQVSGKIHAHHNNKTFAELLAEFLQEYDQFSPYEDQHTLLRLATKWQPFWTAEGETLCKDCHIEKHKKAKVAL